MTLTEALQLLKEDRTDEFMAAVRPLASAVLTEKPWRHVTGLTRDRDNNNVPAFVCQRCDGDFPERGYKQVDTIHFEAPGCPVPPLLEGSAADIAEQLIRHYLVHVSTDVPTALYDIYPLLYPKARQEVLKVLYWWGFPATPEEQIAVCLEALAKWEV
jgi:hypothetical protein